MMAGIGPKDTKPEMIVRKGLHGLGFRFRLHSRHLAGKPDLVLPKYRAAVFINGCFWHAHKDCSYFRLPKTRTEFWREKLAKNVERDQKNAQALITSGWRVLTVWECATKRFSLEDLLIAIAEWLRSKETSGELPNKRETI
tara:strand:+ start:1367 stop:1789 length:423 start_codon:yes stop_codon:yes gene_type:complete